MKRGKITVVIWMGVNDDRIIFYKRFFQEVFQPCWKFYGFYWKLHKSVMASWIDSSIFGKFCDYGEQIL